MSLRRGGATGCSGGTWAKFVCSSLVTCNHHGNTITIVTCKQYTMDRNIIFIISNGPGTSQTQYSSILLFQALSRAEEQKWN